MINIIQAISFWLRMMISMITTTSKNLVIRQRKSRPQRSQVHFDIQSRILNADSKCCCGCSSGLFSFTLLLPRLCGNKADKALSSSLFANKLLEYSEIPYWQIDNLVVVRLFAILK